MLNVLGYLPQKYSDNILVTHNSHDVVYEIRGFQLHSIHLPSMQANNSKTLPVETNIVDIEYSPGISSLLCCSDKAVFMWDMRNNNPQPTVQSSEQFMNAPFTCCSISTDGSLICCGTEVYRLKKKRRKHNNCRNSSECDEETAHIVYWDTRNLSNPLGSIKDLHSEDIVDVKFDPTSVPGYLRLMDCSEDGVVCLYDMKAEAVSQDDSLLYMFNSESVASSCDWLTLYNDRSSNANIVGVYCTTTMRSSIKAWPIHPSMLHNNNNDNNNNSEKENFKDKEEEEEKEKEFSLSEKDEKELNEKTQLWNSKFNTNKHDISDNNNNNTDILNGKNFFNMILVHNDEFLLLGNSNKNDVDSEDYPTVFYSNHQSNWTMSCLPSSITKTNSQSINNKFNLQYADFLGKLTDIDSKNDTLKQLCFMVGSQSTVLCSYEIPSSST